MGKGKPSSISHLNSIRWQLLHLLGQLRHVEVAAVMLLGVGKERSVDLAVLKLT
jgi:hypothetical protein